MAREVPPIESERLAQLRRDPNLLPWLIRAIGLRKESNCATLWVSEGWQAHR